MTRRQGAQSLVEVVAAAAAKCRQRGRRMDRPTVTCSEIVERLAQPADEVRELIMRAIEQGFLAERETYRGNYEVTAEGEALLDSRLFLDSAGHGDG